MTIRATGANTQLLGTTEAVYGTAPGGDWTKLPFISCDLGAERPLLASDVLGQGRDPAAPAPDVLTVAGSIDVPIDTRSFGHWLTWLLGAPTTTDTGGMAPYTHIYTSGAAILPSAAIEVGFTDVNQYLIQSGCVANTLSFSLVPQGNIKATIGLLGQNETRAMLSGGGTPTEHTFQRFGPGNGSIKKDGALLGQVVGAKMTYSNGAEAVRVIRSDGLVDGIDPGVASCSGDITVRFADTALMALAEAGTAVELQLGFTLSANALVRFTLHEVTLPKPKLPIRGPGGIEAVYAWQASRSQAQGRMMTVTLINDVDSYS